MLERHWMILFMKQVLPKFLRPVLPDWVLEVVVEMVPELGRLNFFGLSSLELRVSRSLDRFLSLDFSLTRFGDFVEYLDTLDSSLDGRVLSTLSLLSDIDKESNFALDRDKLSVTVDD